MTSFSASERGCDCSGIETQLGAMFSATTGEERGKRSGERNGGKGRE